MRVCTVIHRKKSYYVIARDNSKQEAPSIFPLKTHATTPEFAQDNSGAREEELQHSLRKGGDLLSRSIKRNTVTKSIILSMYTISMVRLVQWNQS